MDPVSHALVGAAIGSLAMSSNPAVTQAAYWAATAGAVLPDADIAARWVGGEMAYLVYHRTWTHALPGLVGIPAVVALALRWVFPGVPWGVMFLWAVLGALSHICLDVTNSYGTACLLPWSRRKLALDLTMIVDLPLVALTASAMLWTWRHPADRVPAFASALILVLVYLAVRYQLHRHLLREAWRHFAAEQPEAISVLPGIIGMRLWYVIVVTRDRYLSVEVRIPGPVWRVRQSFPRRVEAEAVSAASRHPAARVFLQFARHPYAEVKRTAGRTYVTWGDLRFLFRDRPVFTLTVALGDSGEPLTAKLGRGFNRPEQAGGAHV